MASILKADTLEDPAGNVSINIDNWLQRRTIQHMSYTHRVGSWRCDDTYRWIPGGYLDFKPKRSDSRINVSFAVHTRDYGSNHMITHWIFYVDEQEIGRFTRGGHQVENTNPIEMDVPSWGAGVEVRIGWRVRAYVTGNHNAHYYHLEHWNGGGDGRRVPGQLIAEEYIEAPGQPV